MNGIEGVNVVCIDTAHPYLKVASHVVWDKRWQIPVYDVGRWTVSILRSAGKAWRLLLNGELATWPKAIAMRICKSLHCLNAYVGEARDRERNDNTYETYCLYTTFAEYAQWRNRSDADYETAGGV